MGCRLSIDETFLSNGNLYTILTNKAAKRKKGAICSMAIGKKMINKPEKNLKSIDYQ